jgi:hypothetical protein
MMQSTIHPAILPFANHLLKRVVKGKSAKIFLLHEVFAPDFQVLGENKVRSGEVRLTRGEIQARPHHVYIFDGADASFQLLSRLNCRHQIKNPFMRATRQAGWRISENPLHKVDIIMVIVFGLLVAATDILSHLSFDFHKKR